PPAHPPACAPVPEGRIVVERASTPQDLGPKLNRTAADVVRFLMAQGEIVMATPPLTAPLHQCLHVASGAGAPRVARGEGKRAGLRRRRGVEGLFADGGPAEREPRPPVITVM